MLPRQLARVPHALQAESAFSGRFAPREQSRLPSPPARCANSVVPPTPAVHGDTHGHLCWPSGLAWTCLLALPARREPPPRDHPPGACARPTFARAKRRREARAAPAAPSLLSVLILTDLLAEWHTEAR